jgi:hypothetical protein
MNPENAIVKLCAAGMKAELGGNPEDAKKLFMQAWGSAADDYELCIAAHYVARHQESPSEMLRWNQLALNHASAVRDESVNGFYASLYLNLGYSFEVLGETGKAKIQYEEAAKRLKHLSDMRYAAIVKDGITRGLERISKQFQK